MVANLQVAYSFRCKKKSKNTAATYIKTILFPYFVQSKNHNHLAYTSKTAISKNWVRELIYIFINL